MKSTIQTARLANGLQVVHQQTTSNVAYCGLLVGVGTMDEQEHEHGVAHLLEHLFFKGTEKRKAHQLSGILERVGGDLNAYTGKEETMVQATVLSVDFQKAIDVISDMVFSSTFPQEELEKEKEVIFDEIAMYKDSPVDAIFDDFEGIIFSGSPLGRNILGSKKTLKGITSAHVKEFRNRTYSPSKMVLSVVGQMPFSSVLHTAEHYLAAYPAVPAGVGRMAIPDYQPVNQTVNKKNHQAYCVIGGRGYAVSCDKSIGLVLLTNLLGGPASGSLLNKSLREKHALVYSVEAASTFYRQTGMFCISFAAHKSSVDSCLGLIHKELKAIRERKLGTIQLQRAKNQLAGQLAIASDSGEHLMTSMAKNVLFGDQVDMLELALAKLDKLTADDVMEIANEVFVSDQLSTLAYR